MALDDNGPNKQEYPTEWAKIANKGYQGIQENCRIVLPKKKAKKWKPFSSRENLQQKPFIRPNYRRKFLREAVWSLEPHA